MTRKEYEKKWQQDNKDHVRAYKRKWHVANRPRILAEKQRFREGNRELLREKQREYTKRPGVRERTAGLHREKYGARRLWLFQLKAATGCLRCGERDPLCLDFHHRDPEDKLSDLGAVCTRNMEVLQRELDKCDVLCANCHAKMHRRNWGVE